MAMSKLTCSPEQAAAWERLQDMSEPEQVPDELEHVGGFEYFVAPEGFLARYMFGGFTEFDIDDSGEPTNYVTMLVSPELPRHVRGFMVAHLLRHKLEEDASDPHACVAHDKTLQHEIVEREPSLLEPFYAETQGMYHEGLLYKPTPRNILEITERNRYERGYKNAKSRGRLVVVSAETRLQLSDRGLELPDGEFALVGRSKQDGARWFIKLGFEGSRKGHTCKNCTGHIIQGDERITTVIEDLRNTNKYTHHHFHPGCFTYVELAQYDKLEQVLLNEVPTH